MTRPALMRRPVPAAPAAAVAAARAAATAARRASPRAIQTALVLAAALAAGTALLATGAVARTPRASWYDAAIRHAPTGRATSGRRVVPAAPVDLPARWDWRDEGGVTPARRAFPCDASWCFSAVAAIESALLIREGRELDLSEQQILACATPGRGCSGGWMHEAYRFVQDHGLATEACFPYTALESTPCHAHDCDPAVVIAGWVDIPDDVDAIKREVLEGPVSTVILAPAGFAYHDGVGCLLGPPDPARVYVAVLIVGWDDAVCGGEGGWICKANNGPAWGDGGFFTMAYGACGIGASAQRPLYASGQDLTAYVDNRFDGAPYGDGDGWPEPGETYQLFPGVENGLVAATRQAVTATARVVGGPAAAAPVTLALGDLPAGVRAGGGTALALALDRTARPGEAVLVELEMSADGAPAGRDTLTVEVGAVPVLLVDDDEGEDLDGWWRDSLARLGYPAHVWDATRRGSPPLASTRRYRATLWLTGVLGRIEDADIVSMTRLHDAGGALLLSGQDVGWWLNVVVDTELSHAFYGQILGAAFLSDDAGLATVAGAADDPVFAGFATTIGGAGGSGRQDYPSLVAAVDGATVPLEYAPGLAAATRRDAPGRLLYLAFGVEAVDGDAPRDDLLGRALGWLAGPAPDVSPPAVELLFPLGGETFAPASTETIRWRALDDQVLLYARVERSFDGGGSWPELLGLAGPADSTFAWTVDDSLGAENRIRVLASDAAGWWGAAEGGDFTVAEAPPPIPERPSLRLLGNAPNPFNAGTTIHFELGADAAWVELLVYDLRGRLVDRRRDGPRAAGAASIRWEGVGAGGRGLASGAYVYRLRVPGLAESGRLLLVR